MWNKKYSREQWNMSTEAQILRQKQIASLYTHNLNIRETKKDAQFEVNVAAPGMSSPLQLVLVLSPDFPEQSPIIHVHPSVLHPWVNAQMEVMGHEKLKNWTPHTSLGRLMSDLVQEFQLRPPTFIFNPPSSTLPTTSFPVNNSSPHPYRSSLLNNHVSTLPLTVPLEVLQAFPGLDHFTYHELEAMLKDEQRFTEYLEGLEVIKNIRLVLQDLKNENERFAQENLAHEPVLIQLRTLLKEKWHVLQTSLTDYQKIMEEHRELLQHYSKEALIEKLQGAARQAEEESDQMAHAFLDKKLSADDFVKRYRDLRKLYHLRTAKAEKLAMTPG